MGVFILLDDPSGMSYYKYLKSCYVEELLAFSLLKL